MTNRYFFLHLHKTAGTALFMRIKHALGDEMAVYPAPGDGERPNRTLVVEDLLECWRVRGDDISVVTGHFPLCTTELLGGDFRTFTVLRDPVERVLSAVRNYRDRKALDDVDLERIYDDPINQLMIRNHMVKMLSLDVDEMDAGCLSTVDFTPERLERAKQRLEAIDVVGLQSRFEPFCDELAARFAWDLGPPRHANRSPAAEVSQRFRDRIAEENADDIALYEFARTVAV